MKTVDDGAAFEHPLYRTLLSVPGLSVATTALDQVLTWGMSNALWVFPMATSCCGIEFMATAASRVDIDRMGTIVRATPRQADVMVVAGTITVKMAPRVKKLWDQMPEPKWCIAMGSCAISGDFYRNLYSVVPGVDTFLPVDVYVPGCPPNPEALMHGFLRLQEKIRKSRKGESVVPEPNPELLRVTRPSIPRLVDHERTAEMDQAQIASSDIATEVEVTPAVRASLAPDPAERASNVAGPDLPAVLGELGIPATLELGPPLVPGSRHLEVAGRLKTRGYRQLVSIVATHWIPGTGRKGKAPDELEHFEVSYLLRTVGAGSRVATWAVRLAPGEPVASLVPLFAGADWQEREQFDLVGVVFADHPDLRRLMMPENYDRHPLRRDLPANLPYAPWR
ncbi:MAG TPA: NADH-quinone oxidoreductase subunit NuoB [Myxococcaceae bacterium]|nr:NADH-quinone oxidoreductase subunit NuoB [Myxococcaceae bacterium]